MRPHTNKSKNNPVLSPQSSTFGADNFEKLCTELLQNSRKIKFPAPGDSMYPTICDGDVITVAPIKTDAITRGDIILYRNRSGIAAHRVIRILEKGAHHSQRSALKPQSSVLSPQSFFILRGDAAVVFDGPVGADQILGKVTTVERADRRINPYSLKAKICFKARRLAVCLKRFIRFQS